MAASPRSFRGGHLGLAITDPHRSRSVTRDVTERISIELGGLPPPSCGLWGYVPRHLRRSVSSHSTPLRRLRERQPYRLAIEYRKCRGVEISAQMSQPLSIEPQRFGTRQMKSGSPFQVTREYLCIFGDYRGGFTEFEKSGVTVAIVERHTSSSKADLFGVASPGASFERVSHACVNGG